MFALKILKKFQFQLTVKNAFSVKKSETLIYVMTNKHSIKPEKEMRIIQEERKELDQNTGEEKSIVTRFDKFQITEIGSKEIKVPLMNRIVTKVFLPRDYPYSVKEGYYEFTKYSMITGVCFSIMGFISTQVLINSLGLNVSSTTKYAFSAGLNWVIKDGIGQFGTILFSTKFAHKFETNLKQWRMKGCLLLNAGMIMEMAVIFKPQYFLIIASVANILKLSSITVLMTTRVGVIESYSKAQVADITNKMTNQSNFSIFVGNFIGFVISLVIPMNSISSLFVVGAFSALNLYYGNLSLKYVNLTNFNPQRMYIFCDEYLNFNKFLTPKDVSLKEKVFFRTLNNIHFGNKKLDYLVFKEKNDFYLLNSFEIFKNQSFFCLVKNTIVKKSIDIYIFLRLDISNDEMFFAFLYAIKLKKMFEESIDKFYKNVNEILSGIKECLKQIHEIDRERLLEQMKIVGWELDFSYLEEKYCRYHMLFK